MGGGGAQLTPIRGIIWELDGNYDHVFNLIDFVDCVL